MNDLLLVLSWFHPEGILFPDPELVDQVLPSREPFQYFLEAVLDTLPEDSEPKKGLEYVGRLTDWLGACLGICYLADRNDQTGIGFFNLLKTIEYLGRIGIVVLPELRENLRGLGERADLLSLPDYSWYDFEQRIWVTESLSTLYDRLVQLALL